MFHGMKKKDKRIQYLTQSLQQAQETFLKALESLDPFRISQSMGQLNELEKSLLEEESRQRMHQVNYSIHVDWDSPENQKIEKERREALKFISSRLQNITD